MKNKKIIADLKTFSLTDLDSLFNYYKIDPNLNKDEKMRMIVEKMYHTGNILPWTDIFDAILDRDINTVKEFLDQPGFNIEVTDTNGYTPLSMAVDKHRLDIARLLVDRGANVKYIFPNGSTLLTSYVKSYRSDGPRDLTFINLLIDSGVDINAVNLSLDTALYLSIVNDDVIVSRLLIDKGADVNLTPAGGLSPLQQAIAEVVNNRGLIEIAGLLIDKGADMNIRYAARGQGYTTGGDTILIYILKYHGYTYQQLEQLINILFDKGYTGVNVQNDTGETALMFAVDYPEIVKFLLNHGADPNIKDNTNSTVLMRAALHGNLKSVILLVEAGVDVNAISNPIQGDFGLHKETALSQALFMDYTNNNTAVIKYLIKNGANVNLVDLLERVDKTQDVNSILILLDAGAKITKELKLVIKIKIRDLRLQIFTVKHLLNKDEQIAFDTSRVGKACGGETEDYTLESLHAYEDCLKMVTDMVKYRPQGKSLEKLEKKYESHPYFQKGTQ